MIYSTPPIIATWAKKIKYWIKIECMWIEALTNEKFEWPEPFKFDEDRFGHDIYSFLYSLEHKLPAKFRSRLHYSLTSSDIKDTAFSMMLQESVMIIKIHIKTLLSYLMKIINSNRGIKITARTHGQAATWTTIDKKFSVHAKNLSICRDKLEDLKFYGKLSGPVGDNKFVHKVIEKDILSKLGLQRAESNQIVPRIHYADVMCALGMLATCLENLALELRQLQRTEINEIYIKNTDVGSSSMPHKHNPIIEERICGLARMVRNNVTLAMENIITWNERDISHSCIEKEIFPKSFGYVDYMIRSMIRVLRNLQFNYAAIVRNLKNVNDSHQRLVDLMEEGNSYTKAHRLARKVPL